MNKNAPAFQFGFAACLAALLLIASISYAEKPAGDEDQHEGHQHQHEHGGRAKASKKTPEQKEAVDVLKMADALCEKGSCEDSLGLYAKAIELDPKFAEAYFKRGKAIYHLGDDMSAIADFSKAIELNPDYGDAYFQRGVIWYNNGEEGKMIEDFKAAARLEGMDHTKHEHILK